MDQVIDITSLPSELFGGEMRQDSDSLWSTQLPTSTDFLDNFDTDLSFDPDTDFDLEKLCQEILGSGTEDILSEPSAEEPELETLGACASISSRTSSESEPFSPHTPFLQPEPQNPEPTISTQSAEPLFLTQNPETFVLPNGGNGEQVVLTNPSRARVVRIPGFSAKNAIPIVLGKNGIMKDGQNARICILRPDGTVSEGLNFNLTKFLTADSPEESVDTSLTVDAGDENTVGSDVGSPSSSVGRDEENSDEPQALNLTDEERRIMNQENIKLPDFYPLTREEERNLRRIRRKIRNKRSAEVSRKRKQQYVEDLEKRVKLCDQEKAMLQQRLSTLETANTKLVRENATLMTQLRGIQSAMTGLAGKTAPTSTAFLILVMSVAMLMAPNMRVGKMEMEKMDGQDGVRDASLGMGPTTVVAPKRMLLSDNRIAEPINAEVGKLDEFFRNLQAMKRHFSAMSDAIDAGDNFEVGGKKLKFDSSGTDGLGSLPSDIQGATSLKGRGMLMDVVTNDPEPMGQNVVVVSTNYTGNGQTPTALDY